MLPLTPDSSRVSIITDRKKLKNLFEFVTKNNNEVKLVFCDVLFDRSTPEDSGLEKSIVNLKDKFLGVNELIDKVVKKPVIDISTASSSIFVEDGTIIKYPILLQDSIQTVPSAMLTKLDNKMVEAFPPLVRIQDAGWSLGSPILELSVREKDFEVNSSTDSSYIKIGLGELVSLIQAFETDSVASKNLFDQYFKQKILLRASQFWSNPVFYIRIWLDFLYLFYRRKYTYKRSGTESARTQQRYSSFFLLLWIVSDNHDHHCLLCFWPSYRYLFSATLS